jgi:hypothetical protein
MQEQWRDIPGYSGHYQASNRGRIRSVDRTVRSKGDGVCKLKGQIMQSSVRCKYGYRSVSLRRGGKSAKNFLVHRLVALAWLGPRPPRQWVRHGPNGKLDNSIGNLCYGTPSENAFDRIRDGTMYEQCKSRGVRRSDGVEFLSIADAARESNCDPSNIAACCRGDRYKTVGGYGWQFIKWT